MGEPDGEEFNGGAEGAGNGPDAVVGGDAETATDGVDDLRTHGRARRASADKVAKFKGRHTEAIVVAAAAGNTPLLERMLRPPGNVKAHPVDPNSTDASGSTALMWAVRNNKAEVLSLLINTAEDIELDLRDKSGHTALHHAVWGKRYSLLRRLLAAGCDREVRDHVGRTPVCVATDMGDARSLRILLDASTHPDKVPADVNAIDCMGRTPLFHAVAGCTSSEQRTRDTLEELLRCKHADPNISDRDGQTPLMWCAQHNYPSLVRQLGDTGRCHTELADLSNRTALDHAVFEKNPNCAAMLSDSSFIGARVAERHGDFVTKARTIASGPSVSARRATAFAGAKVSEKILPRVRAKIQAAAYTAGGQDWEKLFRFYDKSGDGELQLEELTSAIRRDLKLSPKDVSNDEIKIVLDSLDGDGGGSVDIDELLHFIDPDGHTQSSGAPPTTPSLSWAGAGMAAAAASKWRSVGASAHERATIANFDVSQTIHDMTWKRSKGSKTSASPNRRPGSAAASPASSAFSRLPALGASQSEPMLAAAAALARMPGGPSGIAGALVNDDLSVGSLGSMFGR